MLVFGNKRFLLVAIAGPCMYTYDEKILCALGFCLGDFVHVGRNVSHGSPVFSFGPFCFFELSASRVIYIWQHNAIMVP